MKLLTALLACIIVSQPKLQLVIELFRHGARAPHENLPFFQNITWGPSDAIGELTDIGKHQHYMLGKYIREKYSHLISPKYKSKEVYIQSTFFSRTILSAICQLYGIYGYDELCYKVQDISYYLHPSKANSYFTVGNLPFSIKILSKKLDFELFPIASCPVYSSLNIKSFASKEFTDYVKNNFSEAAKYFIKYYSLDAKQLLNSKSAMAFADSIQSAATEGKLPKNVNQTYVDQMILAHSYLLNLTVSSSLYMTQLATTNLFQSLLTAMEMKISEITKHGHKTPKLRMYSFHDLNILPLVNALKIEFTGSPVIEFASNIFIELHSSDKKPKTVNDFRVNLIYNKEYSKMYTFKEFKDMCSMYILDDWKGKCSNAI